MLGLGLLLWGIIEAPGRGWTSPVIVGALAAAVVVIACFVIWERRIDHPMLPLRFFSNRRYSVAIAALALVLFALLGMFFLMTQYLQFVLGYSPLQAGVRVAPVALTLLVIAPFSVVAARRIGTKFVVASGLALIAVGTRAAVADHGDGDLPRLHRPVRDRRGRGGPGPGPRYGIGDGIAPARRGRCGVGHQRHRHTGRRSPRGGRPRYRTQHSLPAPDGPRSGTPACRAPSGRSSRARWAPPWRWPVTSRASSATNWPWWPAVVHLGDGSRPGIAACVVGVAAVLVVALLPNWGTEVPENGTALRRVSQSGDGRSP